MAETNILSLVDGGYTYMAEEDGVTRIGTVVDVSGVVENVKQRRAHGLNEHALGTHTWSIPLETLDAWAKKISAGALNCFDVADDEMLLDRFKAEHPCFKVKGGWQ